MKTIKNFTNDPIMTVYEPNLLLPNTSEILYKGQISIASNAIVTSLWCNELPLMQEIPKLITLDNRILCYVLPEINSFD